MYFSRTSWICFFFLFCFSFDAGHSAVVVVDSRDRVAVWWNSHHCFWRTPCMQRLQKTVWAVFLYSYIWCVFGVLFCSDHTLIMSVKPQTVWSEQWVPLAAAQKHPNWTTPAFLCFLTLWTLLSRRCPVFIESGSELTTETCFLYLTAKAEI